MPTERWPRLDAVGEPEKAHHPGGLAVAVRDRHHQGQSIGVKGEALDLCVVARLGEGVRGLHAGSAAVQGQPGDEGQAQHQAQHEGDPEETHHGRHRGIKRLAESAVLVSSRPRFTPEMPPVRSRWSGKRL